MGVIKYEWYLFAFQKLLFVANMNRYIFLAVKIGYLVLS